MSIVENKLKTDILVVTLDCYVYDYTYNVLTYIAFEIIFICIVEHILIEWMNVISTCT